MSLIKNWTTASLAASALAFGLTTTALADNHEEGPAINSGALSLEAGIDWTNAYFYRGIAQENQDLILQPYATISADLYEDDNVAITGYIGTWNSLQNNGSASTDEWYEADVFVGLSFALPTGITLDVSYINLYSPRGGASFAEEINFGVSYDDSELLGELALSPYALLAIEVDGGSDGGANQGTYLELGIEPSLTVLESEDYPVSLSLPIAAGFSLDDYYEDGAGGGDDFFGFLSVGISASTPLSFIPAEYGEWSASAGFAVLFLGDSASDIGQTNFGVIGSGDVVPVATVGISMSY